MDDRRELPRLGRPAAGCREGDIPNCSGKLHDPGKRAFRRIGILPQQLRTSPLFARPLCSPVPFVRPRGLGCSSDSRSSRLGDRAPSAPTCRTPRDDKRMIVGVRAIPRD